LAEPETFCIKCDAELTETNWYPAHRARNYRKCKACWLLYAKEHYRDKVLHIKDDSGSVQKVNKNSYTKNFFSRLRLEVLKHYSPNLTCANCGFADFRALSIDHVQGGGTAHLREISKGRADGYYLLFWLKRNNYPSGFQILCMNCQWIKRKTNGEESRQSKNVLYRKEEGAA
jgi:hypothetical protein